ncbi:MAG: hypothetical protein GX616_23170 [Planctomycetes bacterium]|nr:hypothetical protein [Planctomycetota bacterium]
MKVKCSNCQKTFHAPDEWAGRKVKCPQCKQPVSLSKGDDELGFDLGSLGAIETAGQAVVVERRGKPMTLREAQAAAAAAAAAEAAEARPDPTDPTIRACPQCGRKVRVLDLYSEVLCRHCGAGIPAVKREDTSKLVGYKATAEGLVGRVSFYAGFTGAALYPIPAIANILTAMAIALLVIVFPLFGLVGLLKASALNTAVKQEEGSLAWVGMFLTIMFVLEGAYFGSVAYYCLIDTIRSTIGGNEHPPALTWNITKLGAALGGYAALIGFYLLVVLVLLVACGGGMPTSLDDLAVLGRPLSLIVLAIMTFSIPMNIIGLASTEVIDGLNPAKVAVSIVHVLGHYIFMFLIVLIYVGFYVGVLYAIMSWAGPAMKEAAAQGLGVGYKSLIGGILGWSVLIGMGFYFSYMIGRILGLFARTYKENMEFEL